MSVNELVWEREIAAPPSAVWAHLVIPEKMSAWSRAPIVSIERGDGGGPDGVGALRRVTIKALARETSFDEVVAVSDAPSRFVYHVVRGLPLRDHEGVQTLERTPNGTKLVWRVRFEPLVSAMGPAASRMLDKQVGDSLDALARITHGAREADFRRDDFVDDGDARALQETALHILEAQRALAESLRGDPKYWFSRVYQYVTEEQLRFVSDRAVHRAWILRLLPVFHRFYFENLERHRSGHVAEAPWRVAFSAMDRAKDGDGAAIIRGLLLGVRAHIEEDLPRALAEVWREHYRGRCDYVRLRADYLRMAGVFRVASSRLVAEMPPAWIPPTLRVLVRFAPLEIQDWAFSRNYYDVAKARMKAFERGRGLATWISRPS